MNTTHPTPFVVLAQDPGSRNYAISVIQGAVVRGKLKIKIRESFLLQTLVQQLKDPKLLNKESNAYKKSLRGLLKAHKPNALVFERFMTRGIKGATIEYVSAMLGLFKGLTPMQVHAIPAVTWKSQVKKWGIDLESIYAGTKTTPHQIDATLMGVWLLVKLLQPKVVQINKRRLLKAIEKTDKMPPKVSRRRK